MALGAIISAGSSLLGGLFGRRSANSAQHNAENREQLRESLRFERDREEYNVQKADERRYAANRTTDDRRYAANITARDRAYANRVRKDDRRYSAGLRDNERAYDVRRLVEQRQFDERMYRRERQFMFADRVDARDYAGRRLANDRQYMRQQRDQDIARYDADRDFMQDRSNDLAERSAASRGIDFVKMRDDAIKAGYNPMTAMSMAHAYSTQVDYALQGGVYSPGANYTASGPGYNAQTPATPAPGAPVGGGGGSSGGGFGGGAGVLAPASTVAASTPAAPAGFRSAGGGYTGAVDTSANVSSGQFIGNAIGAIAETWFNKPEPRDELAEALGKALNTKVIRETEKAENPHQNFGYDLTKQTAFKPDQSVGVPPLTKTGTSLRPPAHPYSREEYIPVKSSAGYTQYMKASTAERLDIKPFSTLTVGDETELKGELAEVTAGVNELLFNQVTNEQTPAAYPQQQDYNESGITGHRIIPSRARYQGGGLATMRGRFAK